MQYRVTGLLAATAMMAAAGAHAQAAPATSPPAKAQPPKKGDTAKTVEGVTVTGASQDGFRSSIDRRSYGVANDLATTTGSISDALRNIPSVEVDVQGNVSLRGDPNVVIMIDGKPSNQFKGPGGAQALQALPADQIERVEVITNPSAQYSPEGSAGIINLITKQSRKAGRSGSIRANLGTAGRRNAGMSAAYNSNRLTLSGDAAWRHDPQHALDIDVREMLDPSTGQRTSLNNDASNRGPLEIWNLRLGADYDVEAADRLSGEVRYTNFTFHPDELQHIEVRDATGALTELIDHRGLLRNDRANAAAQASYRHKFNGDDHTMAMSLNRERTEERTDLGYTNFNLIPPLPDLFRNSRTRNALVQTELKADYNRPMPGAARLKAGYDLRIDDNDYNVIGLVGVSRPSATLDPSQTNRFLFNQTINAAYATYEKPFGDWTVLGGLRLEDVRIDLDQATSRLANRQAYTRLYPSLHLAYKRSETQQLVLSYSERVQRPSPQDFNAFRFIGTTTAREGNPALKPQITHSFEAGWQYRDNGTFYLATLYYRQNERGVTDVISDLGDNVLLTSKANLSQSRNAGLELVANGRLTKTLSYNASTNIYWNEIDATRIPLGPGLGFGTRRSALTQGGRASVSWQATSKDLFQVNGQVNAKRLLPQGFSDPMVLIFMGYRHRFNDSLSAVVTVQDPFNIYRQRLHIDTPLLRELNIDRGRIQAAFVGLTWSFGAAQKRPQGFDFGGAPG